MSSEDVRRLALAVPTTVEQPHHQMTSFRVEGKIFTTIAPDGMAAHVFIAESEARAAVEELLEHIELLCWGRRLSGVRVMLTKDNARATALVASSSRTPGAGRHHLG